MDISTSWDLAGLVLILCRDDILPFEPKTYTPLLKPVETLFIVVLAAAQVLEKLLRKGLAYRIISTKGPLMNALAASDILLSSR